jgi:hypothetical protein
VRERGEKRDLFPPNSLKRKKEEVMWLSLHGHNVALRSGLWLGDRNLKHSILPELTGSTFLHRGRRRSRVNFFFFLQTLKDALTVDGSTSPTLKLLEKLP